MKYYTGIGSRETPEDILEIMEKIAIKLEKEGWTLRSGGASGADTAFEKNVKNKEIFLPWKFFQDNLSKFYKPQEWTYPIAQQFHINWFNLKPQDKKLHARNVHQILGYQENDKHSSFVICWTPNVETIGGTATAIKIANKYNIPVFNLADSKIRKRIEEFI